LRVVVGVQVHDAGQNLIQMGDIRYLMVGGAYLPTPDGYRALAPFPDPAPADFPFRPPAHVDTSTMILSMIIRADPQGRLFLEVFVCTPLILQERPLLVVPDHNDPRFGVDHLLQGEFRALAGPDTDLVMESRTPAEDLVRTLDLGGPDEIVYTDAPPFTWRAQRRRRGGRGRREE
jgi:hypothetical protein